MCIAILFATPVVDCRQDTEVFPLFFVTSCRRFASVWSSARLRGCLRHHIQDATYVWTPRRWHAQVPGPKLPGRRSFGKPRIRNSLAISGFIFVKDVVNIVRPGPLFTLLACLDPATVCHQIKNRLDTGVYENAHILGFFPSGGAAAPQNPPA